MTSSSDFIPTEAAAAQTEPESQPDKVEAPIPSPAPPTPAEPDPADRWAERFEKMSRQDADMRAREGQLKQAEADLEKLRRMQGLAKERPLDAIGELGITPDEILKSHLNAGQPDPLDQVRAVDAKYQSALKTLQDRLDQMEIDRVGERWESDFQKELAADDYSLVREWDGATDVIRKRVADHYREHKKVLSPKEQLDSIVTEIRQRLEKMSKFVAPQTPAQVIPLAASPAKSSPGPEIHNNNALGTPSRYHRIQDEDEEMARIAAKYR